MATDINAIRRWQTLSEDFRQRILGNVFCSKCMNTTVVDYDIVEDDGDVVIHGKCKTCGEDVARLVDGI